MSELTDLDRDLWDAALEKYVAQHGGCVPVNAADFEVVGLMAIADVRASYVEVASRLDDHHLHEVNNPVWEMGQQIAEAIESGAAAPLAPNRERPSPGSGCGQRSQTDNGEIRVGDRVHFRGADGPTLGQYCGAAIVLALDEDPAWDAGERNNRPSAWIRYTSADGYYRYRSVDVCDLERADAK